MSVSKQTLTLLTPPQDAMKPNIFRNATFEVDALCRLASSLRQGRVCSCDVNQTPADGSFSWVVFLTFDDGVEWVFRSPHDDGAIRSTETNNTLLASEAATLKYIKSHSAIPVPEVYAYSCSRDNDIGVPYILMSKASGFPLSKKWKSLGSHKTTLSLKEKSKILSQLGLITWQLSQLRFDKIGSLFEEEHGHLQVKSCLSRGLVVSERDTLEDLPRGPFTSEKEYFDALVSGFMQHAECLQLSHHCFFAPLPTRHLYDDDHEYRKASDQWNNFVTLEAKIDGSDNRLDYIVIGDCLREIVSNWLEETSGPSQNISHNRFPLHHPDLNVNNIFVDHDCKITCIIDWTFCSTVPFSVLLMPPGLPQSRDELEAPLVAAFETGLDEAILAQEGDTVATYSEKLRATPGSSRFVWLFYRLASFDSTGDFYLFDKIWELRNKTNLEFLTVFKAKQSSDHYLHLHDKMKQEDEPADQVTQRDADYFQKNIVGQTISRKLTLVSEWASRYRKEASKSLRRNGNSFVADDKLWKWVLGSMDEAGLE
ncbi:hypothetical protein FQN50_005244 [Emmonsiellopsis sp. PD_5]|nr:hypothetical protein FQN50_005244 [Emmonsiellopsis sp. PD_5]